ncbi:MAG: MBL fold metallo-hydrolase [candidate division Zixibacteria bacterium SM23_81]|nr:MAG: MBL fold metallo-hydrolase [candidate division Zixibacteria bacterium SM23_81]
MIAEVKKNVYWVGAVDWGIRHFHGYELSTHRGTTYNAYLIRDEKTVLVDTVWGPFADQLVENIRQIIDPSKIDIVVANHAEVDHSGGLPVVMRHAPNATVVVSQRGAESVEGHFHQPWKFRAVKTGHNISIGQNELIFVEAPMLHWPDSMFTYLTGHNILLPNDAFGQHYASAYRFNDEVDQGELYEEAHKYYANILTPFSDLVTKKIDEVLALSLPVDMIGPSHGIIWRKDPLQIVKKYQEWAAQRPEQRAVVIYDTMWDGTRRMAEAIGDGLTDVGVDHKILHAVVTDRNDLLVEVFRAKTVVVGSPTLNNSVLPTIAPLLYDLKGLKFKNKLGAAFGCYGWSGEGVKVIEEQLDQAKIPVIREGIKCKWQPRAEDLEACRSFGREVGKATKKA